MKFTQLFLLSKSWRQMSAETKYHLHHFRFYFSHLYLYKIPTNNFFLIFVHLTFILYKYRSWQNILNSVHHSFFTSTSTSTLLLSSLYLSRIDLPITLPRRNTCHHMHKVLIKNIEIQTPKSVLSDVQYTIFKTGHI